MGKGSYVLAAWLSWLALIGASATAAEPAPAMRTGVLVTPRNFPNHKMEDVADMFRLTAQVGSFAVIRLDWSDANPRDAARLLVGQAEANGLAVVLELSPFKADELKGAALEPPKDVAGEAGGRLSFS